MRQVSHSLGANPSYGIIGNGRVSKHIQHYFNLSNIPYDLWHRQQSTPPEETLEHSDIIVLAIADDAIDVFLSQHPKLNNKLCIHFSGSLQSEHAFSYHPLMTFGLALYDLSLYQNMLFVAEENTPGFTQIFPELNNPSIHTSLAKKAYYHALCVMANNFTTLLWQKFFDEMLSEFNAPLSSLKPFLRQTLSNIEIDYRSALTGPLKRQDHKTIKRNLDALHKDSFFKIYQSFVEVYQNSHTQIGESHEHA